MSQPNCPAEHASTPVSSLSPGRFSAEEHFLQVEERMARHYFPQRQTKQQVLLWVTQALGTLGPAQVRVIPFGSYELGAEMPDSDIDLVCLFPGCFSQEDFFSQIPVLLRNECPEVSDMALVQESYVPLIKCKVAGVKVDLVFGQAGETQVPSEGEESGMNTRTRSIMKGPQNARLLREMLGV